MTRDTSIRGTCIACNERPQAKKGKNYFSTRCRYCLDKESVAKGGFSSRTAYQKRNKVALRKDHCEKCGFVPEHMCQLDLDHIDGNHENNDPTNHQTLCANCHRLKTHLNKDWQTK